MRKFVANFVGAGPVSARKIIEEIIANVVGVAALGDPQYIAGIAINVGADDPVRPKKYLQYVHLGRHRVRPYNVCNNFCVSGEFRTVPKIPMFGDFYGQSLEFPLIQITICYMANLLF